MAQKRCSNCRKKRGKGHRRRHHRGKGRIFTKVKNIARRLLKSVVGGYALDYLQKQRNV